MWISGAGQGKKGGIRIGAAGQTEMKSDERVCNSRTSSRCSVSSRQPVACLSDLGVMQILHLMQYIRLREVQEKEFQM